MKYVYRIVHGLLAAAVFPAFVFLQLFYAELSSPVSTKYGMSIEFSVKRAIDFLMGNDRLNAIVSFDDLKGEMSWPAELDPIKAALICLCVFAVLALITALFLVVWSCISNKRLVYLIAGGAGLAFVAAMMICFVPISNFIESDYFNIGAVLSDGLVAQIAGGFVNVDRILLGSFANGMLILYIAMVVWTGMFYITDIGAGEKKEKKSK